MNRRLFIGTLARAAMGNVTFSTVADVASGYNFTPVQNHPVGYVFGLSIGSVNVPADIRIGKAPMLAPNSNMNVVAVIGNATWDLIPTAPLQITCRVSVANGNQLRQSMSNMTDLPTVQISFGIYDYDRVDQVYFPSLLTVRGFAPAVSPAPPAINPGPFGTAPIFGVIAHKSDVLLSARSVEDPPGVSNFTMTMTISPRAGAGAQDLQMQTSAKIRVAEQFGA